MSYLIRLGHGDLELVRHGKGRYFCNADFFIILISDISFL